MSDAESAVLAMHEAFVRANTHEDVAFLEASTLPEVRWFNLNKSNYEGRGAILALWRRLFDARPDKSREAGLTVSARTVSVCGEAAWVTYLLDVDYDFGDLARVTLAARATEIWCRSGDGWQLAHFHCSEHVPGNMGGK